MPFQSLVLLRLDDHGHWFSGLSVGASSIGQPRVGGRMALLANLPAEQGQVVTVVSTHLESNVEGDNDYRNRQLQAIFEACDEFTQDTTGCKPIIIGGDLNTGNNLAAGNHQEETLFQAAIAQGFHWQGNCSAVTTRESRLTLRPERLQQLDWFCARDIDSAAAHIVPALDSNGTPLSDHELIVSDWQWSV